MKSTYRQCTLEKKHGDSVATQVAWIPTKFVHPRQVVKIKGDNGVWDDGWLISNVGSHQISDPQADLLSREYKYHRKNSDI